MGLLKNLINYKNNLYERANTLTMYRKIIYIYCIIGGIFTQKNIVVTTATQKFSDQIVSKILDEIHYNIYSHCHIINTMLCTNVWCEAKHIE